jgi:Dehydrogenases with different specificities (related to short-chain alcohol dehydrogenases)
MRIEVMANLEGKVAFITGGTSGIGEATAKTLASRGVKVVVSGRRETLGLRVVNDIRSRGGEAIFIVTDVNTEESIKKAISRTVDEYGSLDMGVNNAGIALETLPLADCDGHKLQEMLQTNVIGLFWCMKYEIQQMLKQKGGAIVNLTSIAGLNGIPYAGTYAATKHAVVGLTKSAALDYATKNIRINAVAPGAIRTDIILQQMDFGTYDEKSVIEMFPMKRMGNPQEIANGIAWLCSDESSYVSGHVLAIDGGFTAK